MDSYSLRRPRSAILATLALAAAPAFAASFVVPPDRDLIRRADAIVIATPLSSYTQINEEGGIETVTTIRVEETLKGDGVIQSPTIVEPGGEYHGRALAIPGVPRFEESERSLLLLTRTGSGHWAVTEIVLGKFTFRAGGSVLAREANEINGWDPNLAPHHERLRDAARFLEFVRTESRGGTGKENYFLDEPGGPRKSATALIPVPNIAPFTATSYTIPIVGSQGGRWVTFPAAVSFFSGTTTEPGAPGGGVTAITTAFTAWNNDCNSNVNYAYAGTDNGTHTQGLHAPDGANTILFERNLTSYGVSPFTCSSSGYSGVLGLGGITNASGSNVLGGETFSNIQEGDVEMNQGIANCTLLFNNGDWNSAVTHEVGHTLGFRHSDHTRDDSGACTSDPSLECSQNAIMKSFISTGLNAVLQTWDQHAVNAVYPGTICDPNQCTGPPSITTQPGSLTVPAGTGATLSVIASGSSLTYQWYIGTSGVTTTPINGATSASVNVTPSSTTSYWVRVSNPCGSADSATATVTVQPITGASFFLISPCRVLDTRGGGAIPANGMRNLVVTGKCGVPVGATSLAVNVTVVSPPVVGLVTLYPGPANTVRPVVSTINYSTGRTLANNARITIGADGSINVFNAAGSPLDFLIDVSGYFK